MDVIFDSLLIVGLRLADVSMGTVRIILLTRGSRWRASGIGFVEILIWVLAVTLVVQDLDDPVRMLAYATGFALGTLLGVTIERWLAIGTVLVQILAPVESPSSAFALRERGYPVTELNGEGRDGGVRINVLVLPRRHLPEVLEVVHHVNPAAFVTTEDIALAPTPPQGRSSPQVTGGIPAMRPDARSAHLHHRCAGNHLDSQPVVPTRAGGDR